MKYLITGGCGFLGSNLAKTILDNSDELILFDNLSRHGATQNKEWLTQFGNFTFVHGDIRNTNDVNFLIQTNKPDVIFHLAGQVAMTTSIANPRLDYEINVLGSFNILEAVRHYAPECIVLYSSTNKVYGDLEQFNYEETDSRYRCIEMPCGFDESITLDFHSPYGCSKGAADQYMLDYARIFKLKTVVFRHSSMYGGRQFSTYDQGWIGWFCQKAIETKKGILQEPFTISGTGKQVRDVLHADDIKTLYLAAIEHIEQAKGHAFNIGGGDDNSLSLLELFALLEEKLDIKLTYTHLPQRESDQRVFVANLDKAQAILKWSPQVSANEGISQMLSWVNASLDDSVGKKL